MSRTNEARHIGWYERCKCKCRLDSSVCNSKQRWNDDKCRSECKELTDKGVCNKEFIWNPSNYECECDKSCGVDGEEVKLAKITSTKDENKHKCSYCTLHIVLISVQLTLDTA